MGSRRDKNASLDWCRWSARCRPTLALCGVPEGAYESQRYWWYFLDHASMSTGRATHWFSTGQLSREQLVNLRDFLEQEYGTQDNPPYLLAVVRGQLR